MEEQSRAWIFVGPALLIVAAGLVVPLVRTVILSFKDRGSEEFVGWTNYGDVIFSRRRLSPKSSSTPRTGSNGYSEAACGGSASPSSVLRLVIGIVAGRSRRQAFAAEPGTVVPMLFGFFLAACAVFATVRGTVMNNLWWIVVVTALATAFGLAVAVMADRAKGENIAKSMIFLPMAISFIGAGIIWRFMYVTRNVNDPQTGLLNAIWVGLGELSNSGWQKSLVAAVMILIIIGLLALAWQGVAAGNGTRVGISLGFAVILIWLTYLLLGPGLGGFETNQRGEVVPKTIDFLRETPYNNMWLMVVLIWLQMGFAMVIFSSAIKAVPVELTEAARIDGANESQVFWQVTLPQIVPPSRWCDDVDRRRAQGVRHRPGDDRRPVRDSGDRQPDGQCRHRPQPGIAATLATSLFIGVLP